MFDCDASRTTRLPVVFASLATCCRLTKLALVILPARRCGIKFVVQSDTMCIAAGGLYNIIRGVPMVTVQNGKTVWFMPGQGQLGAEGALAGGMYVAFALCCFALLSAPKWFSKLSQSGRAFYRPVCYALLLAATLLVRSIVAFYTYKTGYRIRFYLVDWLLGVQQ